MKFFLLGIVALCFSFAGSLVAQQPLTNESVIKMVKAEISTPIIISSVQSRAGNYDLSVDSLIGLKTAGVPDTVVAAMVAKGEPTPTPPDVTGTPDIIRTVFIKGDNEAAVDMRREFMKTSAKYNDRTCVRVVGNPSKADAILEVGEHETSGGFLGNGNITTVATGNLSGHDGSLLWSDSKQGTSGMFHTGAGSAAASLRISFYKSLIATKKLHVPCEMF